MSRDHALPSGVEEAKIPTTRDDEVVKNPVLSDNAVGARVPHAYVLLNQNAFSPPQNTNHIVADVVVGVVVVAVAVVGVVGVVVWGW